jgi:hypothetical protein
VGIKHPYVEIIMASENKATLKANSSTVFCGTTSHKSRPSMTSVKSLFHLYIPGAEQRVGTEPTWFPNSHMEHHLPLFFMLKKKRSK